MDDELTRRTLLRATASLTAAGLLTPAAAVARTVQGDPLEGARLHGHVRDLCAFGPRRTGGGAERKASEWVARRLRAAGLRTRIDTYPFRRWILSDWGVSLTAADGVDGLPVPIASHPVWSTRHGGGEVELVDVGLGTPLDLATHDVRGKAVLVGGKVALNVFPTWSTFGTYAAAAKAGAVAMLATSDAPGNRVRLIAFSGNKLDDNPMPAFTIGRQDMGVLRRACARGGARIRWDLRAGHAPGRTRDVVARLPGNGATRAQLVVCAHVDSMFAGALDDATGVAGLIGLAEHFARVPQARRPKDMVFVCVTGHDTGFPHLGIRHWADAHPEDVARTDAFIALDHLASIGAEDVPGGPLHRPLDEERALFTTEHPELWLTMTAIAARHRLVPAVPTPVTRIETPNHDLEGLMAERGVPSMNLTMASPWYHTVDDTPDKVPAEQLARCVAAHRDFLSVMQQLPSSAIRRRS